MRVALELAAVRGACRNATGDDIDSISQIVDEMSALSPDDVDTQIRLDTAFHLAISRASKNPLLSFTTQAFAQQVTKLISDSMQDKINDDALDFHKRLLDAVKAKDEQTAVRLMDNHLLLSMEKALAFSLCEKEDL